MSTVILQISVFTFFLSIIGKWWCFCIALDLPFLCSSECRAHLFCHFLSHIVKTYDDDYYAWPTKTCKHFFELKWLTKFVKHLHWVLKPFPLQVLNFPSLKCMKYDRNRVLTSLISQIFFKSSLMKHKITNLHQSEALMSASLFHDWVSSFFQSFERIIKEKYENCWWKINFISSKIPSRTHHELLLPFYIAEQYFKIGIGWWYWNLFNKAIDRGICISGEFTWCRDAFKSSSLSFKEFWLKFKINKILSKWFKHLECSWQQLINYSKSSLGKLIEMG